MNDPAVRQTFYAGVQCLVLRDETVLLGLRKGTSGAGQWSCPGGHIEFSERPIETAIRELREETGLIGVGAVSLPSFTTFSTEVPYVHVPVLFREVTGEPHTISGEVFEKWAFFPLANLPEQVFISSLLAIEAMQDGSESEYVPPFVKIDWVSIRPNENRNRGYSLILSRQEDTITLIRQWGPRGQKGWRSKEQGFNDQESALDEFRQAILQRMDHGYFVLSVSGDVTVDWVESLFPAETRMRIQSWGLIEALLYDQQLRQAFARDQTGQLPLGQLW